MSTTILILAMMAAFAALRWRLALLDARARAERAEQLAGTRGRSIALAEQELRGIAAAMAGCRRATAGLGLCLSSGTRNPEGPTQQLLRLADDLAQVASGQSVRAIQDAPARLAPIVDAAIAQVGAQIRPGMRHWQVDPALRARTVQADQRALQGALVALLRRAASHSREGDSIALRWVMASETVAIVVEDEGDGLAAHDLQQDGAATPGGTRGLDLGLSLARSLAAAHGGDIRLESAPGIGARAWLTLPRTRLLEAA
ncbi:sensor histidine kinase [Falsiroseomonas oryzae]|uniref:sensor histidine kinase n=1 Tax=Falsiroseomonas oryzae TaxID=2766473 RepID=UPI0022EB9524|nr:ATP-binding protein [Roseomonas sp. MO-31]